jgi:hypothetical protein
LPPAPERISGWRRAVFTKLENLIFNHGSSLGIVGDVAVAEFSGIGLVEVKIAAA